MPVGAAEMLMVELAAGAAVAAGTAVAVCASSAVGIATAADRTAAAATMDVRWGMGPPGETLFMNVNTYFMDERR